MKIDNFLNQAVVDTWAEKVWPTKNGNNKSVAASVVLKILDSEIGASVSYENIINNVVKTLGVNKKELCKELDIYV